MCYNINNELELFFKIFYLTIGKLSGMDIYIREFWGTFTVYRYKVPF